MVEGHDYYPFGLDMPSRSYISPQITERNKELFTGKERDGETGWDYFGARYYDASIGRFLSVDPHADSYLSWTPYQYAVNNPLIVIDPNGMDTTAIFFDQGSNPKDKSKYTAEVYVDVDETIYGPYKGSTYPNHPDTQSGDQNTLDDGTHDFNNAHGHKGRSEKGLNIVNDKNSTSQSNREGLPGKNPQNQSTQMENVNVHKGYTVSNRGSAGCPTIHPNDATKFFRHFTWSGSDGNTGNAKGTVTIYRGTGVKSSVHKSYLKVKQWFQKTF